MPCFGVSDVNTDARCQQNTHRPGKLWLIHMQMWGGAGAKKRGEMSLSESSTGERREGDCMRWGVQERWQTALFTARDAALLREAAENMSIHGDRWQMDEGMTATSHITVQRSQRDEEGFVVGRMERSVTAPCSCVIALAIAVLTLVEFTQAARVAEGADRPRLPAAPALHPTLCRPDPTPRSLRRNAAPRTT